MDATFLNKSPECCYVSTAYNKIRLYDIRQNCKPNIDHVFKEKSPINKI